jgi:hypothetical protein
MEAPHAPPRLLPLQRAYALHQRLRLRPRAAGEPAVQRRARLRGHLKGAGAAVTFLIALHDKGREGRFQGVCQLDETVHICRIVLHPYHTGWRTIQASVSCKEAHVVRLRGRLCGRKAGGRKRGRRGAAARQQACVVGGFGWSAVVPLSVEATKFKPSTHQCTC